MELEQVLMDLLDLRQLYCLMESCFSGQRNARVETLSGSAHLLFKTLLDDATEKVFETYSKIVETPNVSDELCSVQPEKTKNGVPKPKLIFEAPPRIVSVPTPNESIPPMAANSGLSTTPEKRKKCRACSRRSMMRNTFHGEDEQARGSTQNKNARESDWLRNERSSSSNSFVSCPSTSHETTGYDLHHQREKKKQDTAIDYSEDVPKTIKEIESRILGLKLRSRSRNKTLESGLRRPRGAPKSSPLRSDLLTKANANQELSFRNDFGRSDSANRASRLHGCEQEVKRTATVGRIESLRQPANKPTPPQSIHGFVVSSVPVDTGTKDRTRQTVRSHPSRYGSDSGRSRAKEEEQRKIMPRQMVIRPTLLDHSTTELTVLPTPIKHRKDGAAKRKNQMRRKKMNLPREEETEKSQSSSSASSPHSWTSQQSGVRSSDYSSPRHRVGPVDLRRAKASTTKRHKPGPHKTPGKTIGGIRRLKNKLGLIFHHHHHHHDGQLTRVNRRHSTWKHIGDLFHRNRGVKKHSKSRVRKDQVGHFHALAEGFMRHVWKSGRFKPSEGKVRQKKKKKKKRVKRLKWWKLPNKAKGLGNKRRRLKLA